MPTTPAKNAVPSRYREALGGADPLESLTRAPRRLQKLLKGAKRKECAWQPAPDKWSVREVLAHLVDGEFVWGARMRFIAAEDKPPLPAYDENRFVARLPTAGEKAEELLAHFTAVRAANVALIARLSDEARKRTGMHSERGELSLETLIVQAAGHDRVHEAQIERTLGAARQGRRADKRAARAERWRESKAAAPQAP